MNAEHSAKPNNRIHGYDVIRGVSVISMIGFHLCYDLVYLYGVDLSWFRPPLQDVWRASISWTFILIAGIMATYSRSNFKRGCRYLVVAAAIFLVTTVAAVDTPISFGIIYCMGASTLVAEAIRRLMPKELSDRKSMALFAALLGAFLLCLEPERDVRAQGIRRSLPQNALRALRERAVELARLPRAHLRVGRLLHATALYAALSCGNHAGKAHQGKREGKPHACEPQVQAPRVRWKTRARVLRTTPAVGARGPHDRLWEIAS